VRDDEWIATGPHRFFDCWCGHSETFDPAGKTLDFRLDRTHRWVNLGCPENCTEQNRVHGHVHVHCPDCARVAAAGTCCTPK
jgi:hypothetical protein